MSKQENLKIIDSVKPNDIIEYKYNGWDEVIKDIAGDYFDYWAGERNIEDELDYIRVVGKVYSIEELESLREEFYSTSGTMRREDHGGDEFFEWLKERENNE